MTVYLEGSIDHHSAKKVREEIDRMTVEKNISDLVLNLSEITFMDSSGLGLILGRYTKMCSRSGKMSISDPSNDIMRIIRMAGIEKYIKIEFTAKKCNEGGDYI